ncbi:MAG: hypothetical protein IJ538_02165 [Clostridia bacterium]|nr:hypothetical protein [Clostridia bacterium]
MINPIKTILQLTENLDNKSQVANKNLVQNNIIFPAIFSKYFNGQSIVKNFQTSIAKINITKNQNIYLNGIVDLFFTENTTISIKIFIDDTPIYKTTRNVNPGTQQINLTKNYLPLFSDTVNLQFEISSKQDTSFIINGITLTCFGLDENHQIHKYETLVLENYFLISMCDKNTLYYLNSPKENSLYSTEDFNSIQSTTDYSFAKLGNKIYLFRVDTSGNLFYREFNDTNDIFIEKEVTSVSSSSDGEKILLSYVKSGICYHMEMISNGLSFPTKINFTNPINNVSSFYDDLKEKFFLILTDKFNSNYIVESVDENEILNSNLSVSCSIEISDYEVNL